MVPKPHASKPFCFFFLLIGILVVATPATAQYGYGGYYQGGGSGGSDDGAGGSGEPDTQQPTPAPTPTPTPTPRPEGRVSLSVSFVDSEGAERPFPAGVSLATEISIRLELTMAGGGPGDFRLSALALDGDAGRLFPSRGSMSGNGTWWVTLKVGEKFGTYPLLFVAQDRLGNYPAASVMANVVVNPSPPLLMAGGIPVRSAADSRQLQIQNRSWWTALTMRNWVTPNWFENLCDDLYHDRGLLDAVATAVRIDRDRLNITHQMPPKEQFKSYATMEPIMSKYWAEMGITLSAVTANEIGNVFVGWRANSGMVVTMSDDVARVLKVSMPVVKVGNVLNGVGAAMILLDFWSNMSLADSPAEARDAWNRAGYASLDLYVSNLVANTFGAAAALPGMFTSYLLTNTYDTLMGGHKACWFNKMVEQAVDSHYLGENMSDTRAIDKVARAMQSQRGLKATLTDWWLMEAPTWSGMMAGGCGNWDLNEARGYHKIFVEQLMRTAEVEVDGKKYHPWSFYYSVRRKLAIEKQKELSREIATKLREVEGAYISSLQKKSYLGEFQLISTDNPDTPIVNAVVRPLEWENTPWWQADEQGSFTAQVNGHHFSPAGNILLTVMVDGQSYVFVVSRSAFVEVTP